MKGVPNTRNIKQDPDTKEYIVYCIIKKDNYDLGRYKNLLQAIRERDRIIDDGGFEKAVGGRLKHHGKHYHKRGNKFVITRKINGKYQSFGTYDTESEARAMVRKLWKYNWDINQLPPELKNRIKRTPTYYTCSNGKYQISKKIGDTVHSFGAYSSEEEAKEMVEELKKVDWDINRLPFLLKRKIVRKPKYYTIDKRTGKYRVQKNHENYGLYSSESEAMEIVNLLNEADWDMVKLSLEDWNKLTINQPKQYKNYTYDKSTNKYIVYKTINKKYTTFAKVSSEKEAQEIVCELNKVNWNPEELPSDIKKMLIQYNPKHYGYNKRTGKWRVYKHINGKHTSFGEYGSESTAKKIVKKLIANNWNKECLNHA